MGKGRAGVRGQYRMNAAERAVSIQPSAASYTDSRFGCKLIADSRKLKSGSVAQPVRAGDS